jgi:BRCT domain type II-containing protein
MCEAFGATVTTAISGRTDMLIVGRDPGFAKVGSCPD